MIRVYLLEVGELRRQMEERTPVLSGWDKLTDWQREKISRCAVSGTKALCMGGQLLLQYGACEWSVCALLQRGVSCRQQAVLGERGRKKEAFSGLPSAESAVAENGISWHILDLSRLSESIPAPQSLSVAYEPKGKPYILHVPWHYNLSHSGDYAALAISDAPVGLDIQQMRSYRDSLVKRFFSAEETAAYESLVSGDIQGGNMPVDACASITDVQRHNDIAQQMFGDRKTLFYTLWCRKEAYGKLLGTGLTENVLKRNMLEDVGAHLYEYGELSGYRVCVCSRNREV